MIGTDRAHRFGGRRALVTGGSSGIGAATAAALAAAGALVAVSGRNAEALEQVVARLDAPVGNGSSGSSGHLSLPVDLRQPDACARLVSEASTRLGGLDVVVSSAGVGWAGSITDMTSREIDDVIDLNLRAPIHLARAALPHLASNGGGHLVFVGSIAGHLGVPQEVVYSASKAGVLGLTEALRAEVAASGVKVLLVTPGVVDTAFFVRRNRPYERRSPRPIPATAVADAIVRAVETDRPLTIVPRWLTFPIRLHGTWPWLYRLLAGRFG